MGKLYFLVPFSLGLIAAYSYQHYALRRIHSPHKLYATINDTLKIPYGRQSIYGELITPKDHKADTLIIASHGFNGSMTYFKQSLAYYLAQEGYAFYAFDFINGSKHSKSGGKIENMSASDEVNQLKTVLDHFKKDYRHIVLAGESQGGLITTLAYDECREDANALILYYPAYCAPVEARKRLENKETSMFGFQIDSNYSEELSKINVEEKIRKISVPTLLLHGDNDKTVDVSYAYRAKELSPGIEMHILNGKDHGFDQEGRKKAAQYVGAFLKRL